MTSMYSHYGLWCDVICVCVSVSIMARGLSGKRTVHEGNAGGKSMLRRFHLVYNQVYLVTIPPSPPKTNPVLLYYD